MSDNKIILSADSTCDLPEDLKNKYNVTYYPFYINLDDKDYKDNIDIFPSDIFEHFSKSGSLPKTAASSIGEFLEHFKQFTDKGYEVIHISLGHALSSAYENALAAANQLDGVHVIDSCNLSTGAGHLVIAAGKMIEEGLSAKEIVANLNKMIPNIRSSFILDSLDFMAAGGRCPAVAAKAAGMLKCKLYLNVDNKDGSLHVGKMYRGKIEKVLSKYIEDELANYDDILTDDIFITNSSGFNDEFIDTLEDLIKEILPFKNVHRSTASCTISSHCGPKALGILFVSN